MFAPGTIIVGRTMQYLVNGRGEWRKIPRSQWVADPPRTPVPIHAGGYKTTERNSKCYCPECIRERHQ